MVTAALVLGICSAALALILSWLPWVGQIIPVVLGIVAIVLAVMGMKKQPEKKGVAIAALVCGIVGVVIAGLILILCAAVWTAAAGLVNSAVNSTDWSELQDSLKDLGSELDSTMQDLGTQ